MSEPEPEEQQVEFFDFESDLEYQIQFHETLMSRAAAVYNKLNTNLYFKLQFEDFAVTNHEKNMLLSLLQPEQMTYSVKLFLAMFQMAQEVLHTNETPTVDQYANQLQYVQINKNLKQRISDVIKERNSHYHLRKQIAIMDSVSDILEHDPLRVLTTVGYEAILKNDEFNIPKTAKNLNMDAVKRYEKKRQEMAEAFCLLDFSKDVIESCDKYLEYSKGSRPLYLSRTEFFK